MDTAGEADAGMEASGAATAEDAPPPTVANAPEGGLEQWAEDIRRGLEDVELEPRDSYEEVVELHRDRYAYIELFYGSGGELTGGEHPELAAAIEELDVRFEELMELTGATEQIQREDILAGVQEVRLQLNSILELARESDVPLER